MCDLLFCFVLFFSALQSIIQRALALFQTERVAANFSFQDGGGC